MIVIEGVEASGKTTLAARLRQDLGGWSYRDGRPARGTAPYAHLLGLLADGHPRMIVDEGPVTARLRWGNGTWATCFTRHEWRTLQLVLLGLDATVLWLPEPVARAQPLLPVVGDSSRVERFLQGLEDGEVGIGRSFLPRVRLPTDGDLGQLVSRQRHGLTGDRYSPHEDDPTLPFVPATQATGTRRPRFLVIGEEPPHDVSTDGLPDVPFGRGPASALLWEAADAAGLRWWEGRYTNAWTFTQNSDQGICSYAYGNYATEPVSAPLETLVLLGERARRLLDWQVALGGQTRVVPLDHPSSVLRFRHRERLAWARELGQALVNHCEHVADIVEYMGVGDDAG